MGSSTSVQADVISTAFPGKKHVILHGLGKYGERDTIFEQLLRIAGDPGQRTDMYLRRNVEQTARDPGSFAVKVSQDGRKLQALNLQKAGDDPPAECSVCRYNRERGTIAVESQDSLNGTYIQCLLFHNEPARLEFWLDVPGDRQHYGDEVAASFFQERWLGPLALALLPKLPLAFYANEPSAGGDWQCAVTSSLETIISHEELLAGLAEDLRVPQEGFIIMSARTAQAGYLAQQVRREGWPILTRTHRTDAEGGATVEVKRGDCLLATTHFAARREPLRLECWLEYEGGVRLGSRSAEMELREFVRRMLERLQKAACLLQ